MATIEIQIPTSSGRPLDASLALPNRPGPHPGVVVLHEAFGLNDDMRRIAERFAAEGYAAVVPDLYSAGNRLRCLSALLMGPDQPQSLALVETARRYLAERPEVDAHRLAVIGFCMGGGFALLVGARGGVKASSVNYGAVPKSKDALEGVCPVVASYGGKDRLFLKQAERLNDHLEALGVPHDYKLYENVGHSFMSYDNAPAWMTKLPSPMHVGYSEAEAEDAWTRILAFFAEHVRA